MSIACFSLPRQRTSAPYNEMSSKSPLHPQGCCSGLSFPRTLCQPRNLGWAAWRKGQTEGQGNGGEGTCELLGSQAKAMYIHISEAFFRLRDDGREAHFPLPHPLCPSSAPRVPERQNARVPDAVADPPAQSQCTAGCTSGFLHRGTPLGPADLTYSASANDIISPLRARLRHEALFGL